MDAMGPDVQLFLSGMETFRPDDYIDGQRLRQGLRRDVAELLRHVDLIALPSTARTAPQLSEDEIRGGFIDPPLLDGLCRYAFLANLTGLPAVSVPIGDDRDDLPVGLQLIGDAWDEACVLQAAPCRPPTAPPGTASPARGARRTAMRVLGNISL